MVDFNSESTVATPANDVIRILILQRRNDFIEAIENYEKLRFVNPENDDTIYIAPVRARIRSLFRELQAAFKRTLTTEEYLLLQSYINRKSSITDIELGFEYINEWLDKKQLVRVDNRPSYDHTRVTEEDEIMGV
jgi:hypothetical protein